MADVNARIHVNIDTAAAVAQLRSLQSQISTFNNSVVRGNAAALSSQQALMSALASQIGATGKFTTSIRAMDSGLTAMQQGFDKGTLSARQYFRYAGSQIPGLTKAFRGLGAEQAAMAQLAEQRVRRLQTQYVSLGRDAQGVQKVLAAQPRTLASGYATDLAMATQRQQLFNRALQLGSTQIVNWGKNTQWAGRQLMVGFTVPLGMASAAAAKFYMDLDKASIAFRRVYGDMSTTTEETERNLQAIKDLGVEYTKYGIAVSDTVDLAARAAATGAENEDMLQATKETLRLATLGQMDYGAALDATIALQTAFQVSSEGLAETTDFLNAVENQTILTLEDMARAIPRVAPVIKGLGGDVKDLAVFMTALREGGVTAEQGANALKSGLASLINPTRQATEMLRGFGININEIVSVNRGDLMGTVQAFGEALSTLSDFERQQALEQVFGKYQYARIGALFENISRDGSQAARTMQLAGASVEELAALSEKELGAISESVTFNFLAAVEKLKVAIAPIGEIFLKAVTPIVNAVSTVANAFNDLPGGVKTVISLIVGAIGLVAPAVLMMVGLIGNAIGNGLKFVLALRNGFRGLVGVLTGSGGAFKYQSGAALDSAAAMASLEGKVTSLTSDLLIQESAVQGLVAAYRNLAGAASSAAAAMPRGFGVPGVAAAGAAGRGIIPPIRPIGMATGGLVPGTGNKDTIPAMLTPGESVITKEATAKYGPVLAAMNAGTLPGFNDAVVNVGSSGSYLTGLAKWISPVAVMGTSAGNQSARGVGPEFLTAQGQAAWTAAAKAGVDLARRMKTGEKFSIRMFSEMSGVTRLFDRLHGVVARQLAHSSSIEEATARARPIMDRMVGYYLKQEALAGRMTAEQGQSIRRGYRMLIGDPNTVKRSGVVRAERVDVREGAVSRVRTQTEQLPGARGAPLSVYRRIPALTVMEMQQRGLDVPDWATTGQRSHMRSVGADPLISGLITPRVQGRGLSPAQIAEIESVARSSGQTAANSTAVGARTRSPSVITQQVGQDVSRGLIVGMQSATGQVAAAGRASGAAATQGVRIGAMSGLDDIARQIEQRRLMFGDEFGPPQGPVSNLADRPVPRGPSDNLSALQMARGRAKIARRRFAGSLGGLTQILIDGPAADLARFVKQEKRIFNNNMKTGLGGIKKGFSKIADMTKRAGQKLNDVSPSAYRGMPTVSETFQKARALPTKILDKSLPAAINAMGRGADRMASLGRLASDMGQALKYNDIRSASAMLKNALAGTKTVGPIIEGGKKLGDSIGSAWRTVSKAAKDVNAVYKEIGAVNAARMARNIVGLDAVGKSIKSSAGSVIDSVKSFKSNVGSAFRDTWTIFKSEGFRAAGSMAAQITGLNQAWGGFKTGFKKMLVDARDIGVGVKGVAKEMLTNAKKSFGDGFKGLGRAITDSSLRSFDRALGGWKGFKESFTGVGTAFKTAGVDGANAVKTSLKSAAASIAAGAQRMFMGAPGAGGVPLTQEQMQARAQQRQGRFMAGGMALSMASMAPFMMQDEEGKFLGMNANAAGMGMMGGGALLSMVGMVPGKLLVLAAAAAAAGAAFYAWRSYVDDAARKAAEFGANIGGASNALNNMSDMLGKITPSRRQAQLQIGLTEGQETKAAEEFGAVFETESGKQFIESLKNATSAERFNMLSQYIKTAVASGLMDSDSAVLFAKTVGSALEDAVLGTAVAGELERGITEGAKGLLEMARSRESAVRESEAIAETTRRDVQFEFSLSRLLQIDAQDATDMVRGNYDVSQNPFAAQLSSDDASMAIGASLQVIQDFANAAALAKEEYANGTLSFSQYIDILNEAAAAQAKYSNVINSAIMKTDDIGATAQAINDQLKMAGISEEDISRMQEVSEVGTGFWENMNSRASDHNERMLTEQQRMTAMAEAIFSGMSVNVVTAIQKYLTENPESDAARAFNAMEGQGGYKQFQAAGFIQNVEQLGVPGLETEEQRQRFIDIGINFMESGGNLQDFQAFMNSIPAEKKIDIITNFENLGPEQRNALISQYQEISSVAGTEVANTVLESEGFQEAIKKTKKKMITGSGGPAGEGGVSTIEVPDTRELERWKNIVVEAAEEGVFEDLESVVTIILNEEGDLDTLPQYTDWASQLNQLAPEVISGLGIDTQNLSDLEIFGPMAEQLLMLSEVMMTLPEDARSFAVDLMFSSNGEPKTPIEFGKDIQAYNQAMSDLDSDSIEVQKEAAIRLMTMVTDRHGNSVDPSQARQAMMAMIDELGLSEEEFFSLPPTTVTKILQFGLDLSQLRKAAADARRAANALDDGELGDPALAARLRRKADEFDAAASSVVSMASTAAGAGFAGSAPTSGGGGGGGGGGGSSEKTGAELLKEYIEDLETQRKLIGKITKDGSEIKTGFAQALRNAGAPEQLIADIVSKGKDGIKMAKKLLADRAKKLKEVTQLMFSVNRFALIESQRSAAENAKAQRSAQQGLLESGFSFDVASDIASDENTAAAVADSYERVKAAEREVESTKKGTNARKKANEELRKAKQEWENLTSAIEQNIAQQEKLQIANLIGEAEQEATFAARKISAGLALIGKGFNSAIVGKMIVDPAVVNQVSGYVEKLRDLERQKKRITDIDKKDRTDEQKEKLRRLNRQIERTEAQYRRLIKSLRELSEAEKDILVTGAKEGLKAQTTALRREERATNILMGMSPGMTYDEASSLAQNEDVRDAILVGQSDITDLEKKKKTLIQQRQGLDPESEEYKELTRQIKATNRELKKAKEEQKGLVNEAKKLTKEERKASWRNRTEELNKELSLQKKRAKLVEAAGGDQLVLNYLTSMSYEDIVHFLSLSKKEQKEFVELLQDSFTAADKIAQAFDQINENQEYSNSLIEQQANKRYGVMDQYNEEERSLDRQIRATNDLIETAQDQVDVIQEQNDDLQHTIDLRQREIDLIQRQVDDYNRGLELIQREEDRINEYYDERLEALDKVDEINQRIAQRQRDQLALSQALSEGDIYAAAQAAQQSRQSEATNALQESRNALEEARQNAIDNIATDINGTLLNREQIEKRLIILEDEIYEKNKALLPIQDEIYENEQLIYNIQEDTLEPLEAALDALEDQKEAIADLKKDWQDYYDYLAENAVDPLTGMKFKDLQKLRELYEAEKGTLDENGNVISEEEALRRAINKAPGFGIDLEGVTGDALRRAFGVKIKIPVDIETPPQGGTSGDVTNGGDSGENEDEDTSGLNPRDYESYALSRAKVAQATGLTGAALTAETRRYRQGEVDYFAGGMVVGAGRRDSVPIMASPGEFVIRSSMVDKYGTSMLSKINSGSFTPSFNTPGRKVARVSSFNNTSATSAPTMYNTYNVSVTANTNASADDIANRAVSKIIEIQNRQIRSARVY